MPITDELPVAHAEPSKSFFIDMLTRDISLSVCILDLIDNSIHGLIVGANLDVSQHLISGTRAKKLNGQIDVSFDKTQFTITDNCGGVSIQEATEHAFLLGNPVEKKTQAPPCQHR